MRNFTMVEKNKKCPEVFRVKYLVLSKCGTKYQK